MNLRNTQNLPRRIFTKIKIPFILVYIKILKLKLIIYKKLHNIKGPIIHVYTVCWNEEKFLPFFLKHYDSFCDKIIVYDNESTDNTIKILNNNPKVEIVTYKTNNQIDDETYQRIKNNAWKKSRGKADWVIICDIDELLYDKNNNIKETLKQTSKTIFKPEGYEMISEQFPKYNEPLREQCKGVPNDGYCKKIIFDPHNIVEINYWAGAHEATPKGIVKYGFEDFIMLHYKHIGVEYVIERYKTYANRLSQNNIKMKFGTQYLKNIKKIKDDFERMLSTAKEI